MYAEVRCLQFVPYYGKVTVPLIFVKVNCLQNVGIWELVENGQV